ncbi:hypothetical protein CRENBAI_009018 [Crenichthys baileyi]|uniref:Secreted protein n=1 Tax=Crenichthys baileyi TaxID=28760 RepID=A0AAV9RFW5_9TELE
MDNICLACGLACCSVLCSVERTPGAGEQWAAIVRRPGTILGLRVLLRDPEWQSVGYKPWPLCPLWNTNLLL